MSSRLSIDERRSSLIEAAIGLAERKGVAAVTTRDVARAAGVSLGVVHYCFDSKDELMTEVVKALAMELRDSVEADQQVIDWHERGTSALRTLIRVALAAMWHNVEQTYDRQLLTYETTTYSLRAAETDPGKRDIAREQYEFNNATLVDMLEKVRELTATTWRLPVTALSRLVLSMIDGLVLRWLVDEDSAAANDQLDVIADLVAAQAS
ncbi:TetR family transcriptional regulator [Skermania sp. ID1734]|uniref:TetR/AcrR family transcriptional regulator n=1 Tax=Skermania sp. ID1734 TaxID=2597516 RepID=UPI0011803EEA|nr:TetR/AcrR family transcriptional regulator [Skermania sp. ID1734]TSD96624.1 TetR family transcriptional regulator [Skermania sp. ID1734]